MKEIWKPVKGFEDFYEVSSYGRVKRTRAAPNTRPGRILVPGKATNGYSKLVLQKTEKRHAGSVKKYVTVHALVAEAFIGERPEGLQCNHINGIKTDNRVENLEYVTPSQNRMHSCRVLGRGIGSSSGRAKLTEEQVRQIRKRHSNGEQASALAKEFGLGKSSMSSLVRRLSWTHVI